jgi:hypothetical protein
MEAVESEEQLAMEATEHLLQEHASTLKLPPPPLQRHRYLFFMDFLVSQTAEVVLKLPNAAATLPDEGAVYINFFPRHVVLVSVDAISRSDTAWQDVHRDDGREQHTTEAIASAAFRLNVIAERLAGLLTVPGEWYTHTRSLRFAVRGIYFPTTTPPASEDESKPVKMRKYMQMAPEALTAIKDPKQLERWVRLRLPTAKCVHYEFNPVKFTVKIRLMVPEDVTVIMKGHCYFQ